MIAKYRVWCVTEDCYVESAYVSTKPTECPHGAAHTIIPELTIVVRRIGPSEFHVPLGTGSTVNSTSWTTIAGALFRGLENGIYLSAVGFLAQTTGGTYDIRVRNTEDSETIAERTGLSNTSAGISWDSDLENVPLNPKMLLIQVRVSSAAYTAKVYDVAFIS